MRSILVADVANDAFICLVLRTFTAAYRMRLHLTQSLTSSIGG